jgi:hypothetical protein
VGPWWYTVRYLGGALPDGAATTFLFFMSLFAWIASSVVMTLLTNSGNDPPVLSAMRSCSLVERPIMKRSFFLSSVSTWSDAYCPRWLNNLEKSCTDRPPCFRSMKSWPFFLITPARMWWARKALRNSVHDTW